MSKAFGKYILKPIDSAKARLKGYRKLKDEGAEKKMNYKYRMFKDEPFLSAAEQRKNKRRAPPPPPVIVPQFGRGRSIAKRKRKLRVKGVRKRRRNRKSKKKKSSSLQQWVRL